MDWTTIAVALIAALPGLWALRHQRRASDATAAGDITESALKLVEANEKRVTDLEEKINSQAEEIKELRRDLSIAEITVNNTQGAYLKQQLYTRILVTQMEEAGITPRIEPDRIATMPIPELREETDKIIAEKRRGQLGRDTLRLK